MNTNERTNPATAAGRVLTAAALVLAAAGPAMAVQGDDPQERDPIEEIKSARAQLIELKKQISKEKSQLAESRQFLRDRISLAEDQIAIARSSIEEAREEISGTSDKLASLEEENETLEKATSSLEGLIDGFEKRTLALMDRLPAPALEQTRQLAQNIPTTPEQVEKKTLYDRFIAVVGILNMLDKFNTGVEVTTEQRDLQNGESREVTSIYLGLSQGYYVDSGGTIAGRGTPAPTGAGSRGFVWTPIDESAADLQRALKIYENTEQAAFVRLPIALATAAASAAPATTSETTEATEPAAIETETDDGEE